MKKNLFAVLLVTTFSSCADPSPESLAQAVCDCFQKVKETNNTDNKIEQTDECTRVFQTKYLYLKEIEKDRDMNDVQVKEFEARFTKVYNNCK